MKLRAVTVTGADDSVDPAELVTLSRDFPFVEWGLLLSHSSMGSYRFPSSIWLHKFASLWRPDMRTSCHLCGQWVRSLLRNGEPGFVGAIGTRSWEIFDRLQFNFHAKPHQIEWGLLLRALENIHTDRLQQFIFQFDSVNNGLLTEARKHLDAVPLFDTSGGAGRVPGTWPAPLPGVYCGYAGGLGPANLTEELARVAEAAGDTTIWIDAETRLRSDDNSKFDLHKVRQFLELAAPYVERSEKAA